jgi:serine protease Do
MRNWPTSLVVLSAALAVGGCHAGAAHAAPTPGSPSEVAPKTSLPVAAPTPLTSAPAPFTTPPVLAGTPDVATLVAKVKPAVVSILVTQELRARPDPFFSPFFGGRGDQDQIFRRQGAGSGFIIDPRGYVVTNAHVVEKADKVRVRLADDREFDARVKGRDARLDLAVLELQRASNLPVCSLGSSESTRVGEYVVAIGNPFGLGHTVTMGIVSAKSRTIGAGPYDDFIQTDASINPGNSGGPLFNLLGQVVGINTAINPQGRGIGFAIPVDMLKDVLPQLLSTGQVSRGRLGVSIQPVDGGLAKALGLDKPRGALVAEVERGGPAERSGLKTGDVIVAVDGADVPSSHDLPRLVARHTPGTKVKVRVVRDMVPRDVEVTLDALKDEVARTSSPAEGGGSAQGFGLTLRDSQEGGALIERVQPGSAADESLEAGDVIVEINRTPVSSAAEAQRLLQASRGAVLLKVKREGHVRYVAIER